MKKKDVLIMTYGLGDGGVEKSLIEMLRNVNYELYNIDLIITQEKENKYIEQLPQQVNLITKPYLKLKELFKLNIKKLNILKAIKILYVRLCKLIIMSNEIMIESMGNIEDKHYDYAIAYHSEFQMQYILKINADRRIGFMHVSSFVDNAKLYGKIYDKLDLLCCVSKAVKEKLININPFLANKTVVMPNIINVENILKLAENNDNILDENYNGTKILTVGRIDPVKGYELAIDTCKKLLDNGYKIKWYVVGDGNYRKQIEKIIIKNNLEKQFILLGAKTNPYSYMKQCDIYVQPSLDETYCLTSAEAKVLNKPIVRTNTPGVDEQFENMKNGIITDISVDGLYNGIKKYLDDEEFKNEIIRNLENENKINNKIDQIQQIEKILQEKGKN